MDQTARQWRAEGLHLPEFMRDFHDQKDLFKAMHERIRVEDHPYAKEIGWVTGQCYIIDVFLWFMAMHGYTIQKTRKQAGFDDIRETMRRKDARARELEALRDALFPQPTTNDTRG